MLRVIAFGSLQAAARGDLALRAGAARADSGFALTGYLLPWDQRAYWATVVTINISKLTPLAGEIVAGVLRGGSTIGALTLTRWYSAHVIFLPAALVLLVGAHLVPDAAAGDLRPGARARRDRRRRSFPRRRRVT